MSEKTHHPEHYGGDTTYEVDKCLAAWGLDRDAYLYQACAYIARAGKKDPDKFVEDLEKAVWNLHRRIAMERAKQ